LQSDIYGWLIKFEFGCIIYMKIYIKRVYEKPARDDGVRILVDRMWPRGITKQQAKIDLWMKEWAPSTELRKFLHADNVNNYQKFTKAYLAELKDNKKMIRSKVKELKGGIMLITAVKDVEHSHIPTLKNFLNTVK
jgi:uncharacterized protein YeaO (DUF488 family)